MRFTHINPVHRVGSYTFSANAGEKTQAFYLASVLCPALRWQYADGIARSIRHRGWYCNEFQDCTMRGIVFRLPRSRGFLAGWTLGEGMIGEIDRTYIYGDEREAAHAADDLARSAADEELAYQTSLDDLLE